MPAFQLLTRPGTMVYMYRRDKPKAVNRLINKIRRRNHLVPACHNPTVTDHWMSMCLRALTVMHDMQPLSLRQTWSRLESEWIPTCSAWYRHVRIDSQIFIRVARPNNQGYRDDVTKSRLYRYA